MDHNMYEALPRILHVEDDKNWRELTKWALEDAGFGVVQLDSVIQALHYIGDGGLIRDDIRGAILDENLPGGKGSLVAHEIRQSGWNIPIIANSNNPTKWGDFNIQKGQRDLGEVVTSLDKNVYDAKIIHTK